MVWLQFIILGILQGLTEFLPISSSGHLLLFLSVFGISEVLFVSIILHFATLLSICVVMRKELLALIKKPFSKEMGNLILSSVATFIIVILIYDIAKSAYFESFLPLFFMITACLLFATDLFSSKKNYSGNLTKRQSVVMGICQGLAIFPGLSRSGTTICGGVLAGGNKEKVAKHSFLMSIPVIIASMFMEILDIAKVGSVSVPTFPLIVSFLVAFLVGVFALKFMLKLTCKVKFRYFAYYLAILSIICMVI